jgi:hypothetical protein
MVLTVLTDAYAKKKCGENVAIRRGANIRPRLTPHPRSAR